MDVDNLGRMIRLAEEFFGMRNDPEQLSVDAEAMAKLRKIHPCTMSEEKDENGPIAWILVIPTAHALMDPFVRGEINERQLLDRTIPGGVYGALYLCSALVLPEHRGKGLARRLTTGAIRAILHDHPIRSLFYWSFSAGGDTLAASVAREFGLPLYGRKA